jgi:tetratricopeptide (TPR) repeat protein
LGALGVFNITKHSTKEKSIQIDHEIVRDFGAFVMKDETIGQLADDLAVKGWHEVYAKFYFDQYNWEDHHPDRAQKYALEYLPKHTIEAEIMDEAKKILLDKTFIRGRVWTLGCTEGSKAHVKDVELFWEKFHMSSREDCDTTFLRVCEAMESVLMDEVSRDTVGPAGHCSIVDAGLCLYMVSVSLGKMGLWEDASKLCTRCVDLVSRSSDGLVGALLYNSAFMHSEANNFDVAKAVGEEVLSLRARESGNESIAYAQVLSLLGDIMFKQSDYQAAEVYFTKSIDILKPEPQQCNLAHALALLKLGKTQYERGLIDDALECYDEFYELAQSELPPNHEYFIDAYNQIGNALWKKGNTSDAVYSYEKALKLAKDIEPKSRSLTIRMSLIDGGLHSINGESDKAIEQYKSALKLLRQYEPCNIWKIARVISFIGVEFMENGDVDSARAMFQESIRLIKHYIPMHFDLANVLLKLSHLEESDEKVRRVPCFQINPLFLIVLSFANVAQTSSRMPRGSHQYPKDQNGRMRHDCSKSHRPWSLLQSCWQHS